MPDFGQVIFRYLQAGKQINLYTKDICIVELRKLIAGGNLARELVDLLLTNRGREEPYPSVVVTLGTAGFDGWKRLRDYRSAAVTKTM